MKRLKFLCDIRRLSRVVKDDEASAEQEKARYEVSPYSSRTIDWEIAQYINQNEEN